jgi:hypothetical protein
MPEATVVEWIRCKYVALVGELDERGRRRWAATEAMSLGRGGIAALAEATGISDRTIRNGIQELKGADPLPLGSPAKTWCGSSGKGRRAAEVDRRAGKFGRACDARRPDVVVAVDVQEHTDPGRRIETPRPPGQSHEGYTVSGLM